jgi:hypothetical protein
MSDNPTPGDELVERLRKLLSNAIGLPWQQKNEYEPDVIVGNVDGEIIDGTTHYSYDTVAECLDNPRTSAPLIVEAVNALPALLDELEALRTRDEAARSSTTGEEVADAVHEALWEADAENKRLREALEPFALVSSEGVVKNGAGHVTVTTCASYFHRAAEALQAKDHSHAG